MKLKKSMLCEWRRVFLGQLNKWQKQHHQRFFGSAVSLFYVLVQTTSWLLIMKQPPNSLTNYSDGIYAEQMGDECIDLVDFVLRFQTNGIYCL